MKALVIIIVLVFGLIGCISNTNNRNVICKVKAELLLPTSYGDSTNAKELFYQRLDVLYPQAIEGAIARNEVDADPEEFTYEIVESKHGDRIIQFYLFSYIDCNCRNIQDTLLYQLHSDFLKRYPDNRTVEFEARMSDIANELDSLKELLEPTNSIRYVVEHGIHFDTIKKWEQQYTKLLQKNGELRIENASYLYEFFTVLNSGSSVK